MSFYDDRRIIISGRPNSVFDPLDFDSYEEYLGFEMPTDDKTDDLYYYADDCLNDRWESISCPHTAYHIKDEFNKIFSRHGLSYIMGHYWSFTCYLNDEV